MKRETIKVLLEGDILQAYANGEPIDYRLESDQSWRTFHGIGEQELTFNNPPEYYRLPPKPEFKVNDWVLYGNKHYQIKNVLGINLALKSHPRSELIVNQNKCIPVRRVVNPHTFESAVKAVAEKGPRITSISSVFARIQALGQSGVKMQFDNSEPTKGYSYSELTDMFHDSDNSPFGIVTYEEIT